MSISEINIGVLFSVVGSTFIGLSYSASKHAHNSFLLDSRDTLDIPIEDEAIPQRNVTHYPQWWLSIFLLIIGEAFNFMAYGYAPTSVIAPLGTLSIIAGAVSGYFYLGEKMKLKNCIGMILCIVGAILVVLCTKSTDTSIPPDEILAALSDVKFIVFCCLMLSSFVFLYIMDLIPHHDGRRYGDEFIVIRVLLTSISSGFTVLATKAVASMIKYHGYEMFLHAITYCFLLIMLISAIATLYFTNKALASFDSTKVLPAEFAAFTLVAVVGSAIMFHDFEKTNLTDGIIFAFGCAIIFCGVYLITTGSEKKGKNIRSSVLFDKNIVIAARKSLWRPDINQARHNLESTRYIHADNRISLGDKFVGVINALGSTTRASLCFQQVVLPESRDAEYLTIDESLRYLDDAP